MDQGEPGVDYVDANLNPLFINDNTRRTSKTTTRYVGCWLDYDFMNMYRFTISIVVLASLF